MDRARRTSVQRTLPFDPFKPTRWRVVAGGDPGYLVTTPMRRGAGGWFIACQGCRQEFESEGLRCCARCERKLNEGRALDAELAGDPAPAWSSASATPAARLFPTGARGKSIGTATRFLLAPL